MGHGDLMSQAEDVADQVSSSTRETRTQSRPHRRLGPGQAAESFRCFMNPVDPLKAELKQEEVKPGVAGGSDAGLFLIRVPNFGEV